MDNRIWVRIVLALGFWGLFSSGAVGASNSWTLTNPMMTARAAHSSTLLANGRVLVAGGYDYGTNTVFASAELFDPATGTWSPTGSMMGSRSAHMAVRLRTGKVLVSGGYNLAIPLTSAELYDSSLGSSSAT